MTLEKALDDIEFNGVLDTYDFPKAFSFLNESEDLEKLFLLLQEENLNPLTGFTKIPEQFLKKCSKITKIEIPDTITSIGSSAFYGCSSLTSVYYKGTASEWSAISIDYGNDPLTNATKYYYSETEPAEEGNYWHYVDGVPTKW